MTDTAMPWSFVIPVAKIPDAGLHQELIASAVQLSGLAALAGVREIRDARADLNIAPVAGDRFHVTGRVSAMVGQTCVVTLDPLENLVDESVDVTFAPPSQIPVTAKIVAREEGDDAEIPDPPEPIVNGTIDLGRLATELLVLGIDPYPRSKDAVFEPLPEVADPDEHPFAALRALTPSSPVLNAKKPKDR